MAACSTTSAVDSSCTLGRRIIGNRPALLSSSISIRSTPLWLFSAGAQRLSATPQRHNLPKENYEKLLKRNIKLETEMEEMNSSFQGLKENYERLLKWNVKLEYEMAGMNSSFQGLKDEMLLIREEKSNEKYVKKAVPEAEMIEDAKGGTLQTTPLKGYDDVHTIFVRYSYRRNERLNSDWDLMNRRTNMSLLILLGVHKQIQEA